MKRKLLLNLILIEVLLVGILLSFIIPQYTRENHKRIYPIHYHEWDLIDTRYNTSNNNIIKSELIFGLGDSSQSNNIYKLFGFNNNKFIWQKNERYYTPSSSHKLKEIMIPFHLMNGGLTIKNVPPIDNFINHNPIVNVISETEYDKSYISNYIDNINIYIRKVNVKIELKDSGWTVLRIPSKNIIGWSYDMPLPYPNNDNYYIRYNGGYLSKYINFDLYITTSNPINIHLSTCYTKNHLKSLNGNIGIVLNDLLSFQYDWIEISPQVCEGTNIII